jgi:hypothetical protein
MGLAFFPSVELVVDRGLQTASHPAEPREGY